MPSPPRPAGSRRTAVTLLAALALLLVAVGAGAAPVGPSRAPIGPGLERPDPPGAPIHAPVSVPVPSADRPSTTSDQPVPPSAFVPLPILPDAVPPAVVAGHRLPAATGTQSSTQSDPEPPSDPTPPGIETVYGNPDVVTTAGGGGVDVAVLDSGVDRNHPDLSRRIEVCRDYTGPSVHEGRCADTDGHGTHVAGTILADSGRNGTGLYGVAPAADLWALKVCSGADACSSDDVAQAIDDAAAEGAEIVVLSIGGERSQDVSRAISRADSRGVLLVAAAGNAGPALDTVEYPAADQAVVAVGAVEQTTRAGDVRPEDYRVPDFSSRGVNDTNFALQAGYLDVAAPGSLVTSTWPGGEYRTQSGTSFAVAHVAGVATRLWQSTTDRNGDGRVNDDVRRALGSRASTFDVTRGEHARQGYDPAAGLGVPRVVSSQTTIRVEPAVVAPGQPVTLVAAPRNADGSTSREYAWDTDGDGQSDHQGERVTATFPNPGTATVTLRTTDADGTVSQTTAPVRVNVPPTAAFVSDPAVSLVGEPVRFTAIGSGDPDGQIETYAWDMDGDGSPDALGPTTETVFDSPGPTPVTLSVTDDAGVTTHETREVVINDRPRLVVPASVRVTAGKPVTLSAAVEDRVGAVTVTWHFPDGQTATGLTAETSFAAGRHPIRVAAADEYGAESERVIAVIATRSTPTASPAPAAGHGPSLPLGGFTPTITAIAVVLAVVLGIVTRFARL